jgi:hypothetical protein
MAKTDDGGRRSLPPEKTGASGGEEAAGAGPGESEPVEIVGYAPIRAAGRTASAPVEETAWGQIRRAVGLFFHVAATSLDVALLVLGTGLIGLAAVVVMDGFDLVELGLTAATGEMLGAGLVLAVFGAFALGVAVEGPIGTRHRDPRYSGVTVAALRALSLLAVGALALVAADLAEPAVADLPYPFEVAVAFLRSTGRAGMTVVLILAVPLLWVIQLYERGRFWIVETEAPAMYAIWAVTAAVFLDPAVVG